MGGEHTPVPRAEVERLLELAARSASNSNCQPWQVHVLTGAAKQALTVDLLEAFDAEGRAEVSEFAYQPQADQWPEPFRSRQQAFGESLYRDVLGIAADDATGRRGHHRRNYEFFGAPVALIVTVSRGPLLSALVDAGLFVQALMLAARGTGLHTCPQASLIDFHPVLRLVCRGSRRLGDRMRDRAGLADDSHRVSSRRSSREPITSFARFYDS